MTEKKDIHYPRGPRGIIEDVTPPPSPPPFSRKALILVDHHAVGHHADMMDWWRWAAQHLMP